MAPRKTVKQNGVNQVVVDWNLDEVPEDWEALVSAGMMLNAAHESNRWRMGDLGIKFVGKFKAGAVKKFVNEFSNGATAASTFYEYTATSAMYSDEDRVAFPNLSWSHYRQAKGRATLVGEDIVSTISHEIAMVWLSKAADEGWSVRDLKAAMEGHERKDVGGGKPPAPTLLLKCGAQFLRSEGVHPNAEGGYASYVTYFETVEPIKLHPKAVYELQFFGIQQEESEDDND